MNAVPIPLHRCLGRAHRRLALGRAGLCPAGAGARPALAIAAPQVAGLAGYALLAGIAVVALLFLFAVWPRTGRATQDALRVAEAAGKANIAWAITGEGGAVLDCNPVYRRMAGRGRERNRRRRPNWRWRASLSAAVLYRLSRDAAEGRAREESFRGGAGAGDRRRGAPAARQAGRLVVHARAWPPAPRRSRS